MRILLTNDDGINARGIHALINELNSLAELYVVAPDRERSGTGHSITVFEPIKVAPVQLPGVRAGWVVGGTPVDCVKLALSRLITENIDLVVSGINHGPNLGSDVVYSGTVSAAAEAVMMGYPALAVSYDSYAKDMNFDFTAKFTKQMVKMVLEKGMEKETLLNINVPSLNPYDIKGIRIASLGVRNYDNLFEEYKDPRGNTFYWLGGGIQEEEQKPDSDVYAVQQGYISLTPIHLDLTDYKLIEEYKHFFAGYLENENLARDLDSF
ncbi:MAG: 5'/3'-nucleotidase SurE [Syntrophomonadaceae bacterium]|jgi:5'-nucleotidase